MIKLIGCVLIVVICTLIGANHSGMLKEHTRKLRRLLKMLEDTALMIRYRKMPVNEITDKLREKADDAVLLSAKDNGLSEDENRLIKQFLSELGTSDTEGQISMISSCLSVCRDMIASSEREEASKCRLYEQLGFMMGAFIAVLMI